MPPCPVYNFVLFLSLDFHIFNYVQVSRSVLKYVQVIASADGQML